MRPQATAALANAAYSPPSHLAPGDKESLRADGEDYEVLARRDAASGYQGVVSLNVRTKEIIVAHRGTEFDRQALLDGGVDAAMVTAR
ncbi:hemolysin, partial [Stenotrophomonas indicatrix]|nr:hemolysin [Stenotrophomonas indicatrix]